MLFGLLWLMEVAGDPTGGFAFFTLVLAAPLVVGIGLVVAASRRRDLFATRGLVGAIVLLVGWLVSGIVAIIAGVVGLGLIAASLSARGRGLIVGIAVLAVGLVGLALRLDAGDGIDIFVPFIAVGAAVFALTLRHFDA